LLSAVGRIAPSPVTARAQLQADLKSSRA
jgi:hypothetical protein